MKRSTLCVLAASLIAATILALLPTQQPASADDEGKKVIAHAMDVLTVNYRKVRRQMNKPDMNADTANLLAEMIAVSVQAKAYMPATASTDDLKNKYRVVMNQMIIALANAENAALAGENAQLKAYVLQANQAKGEGHEHFIPQDE